MWTANDSFSRHQNLFLWFNNVQSKSFFRNCAQFEMPLIALAAWKTWSIVFLVVDDEPKCWRVASVQTGSPQNPSSHHLTLLPLQDYMGLGHPDLDLLYGCDGALQRSLQNQNHGSAAATCDWQYGRCCLLCGHRAQLPHYLCWTQRGGHFRP